MIPDKANYFLHFVIPLIYTPHLLLILSILIFIRINFTWVAVKVKNQRYPIQKQKETDCTYCQRTAISVDFSSYEFKRQKVSILNQEVSDSWFRMDTFCFLMVHFRQKKQSSKNGFHIRLTVQKKGWNWECMIFASQISTSFQFNLVYTLISKLFSYPVNIVFTAFWPNLSVNSSITL